MKNGVCLLICLALAACTTTTIDEHISSHQPLATDKAVVVLGRRHAPDYETEPWLVSCLGERLARGNKVEVIGESEFKDAMYPWFEARTAPQSLKSLQKMMAQPLLSEKMQELGVQYLVWLDGSTKRRDASGAISCAVGPGGGGCLGFSRWEDESDYTAAVWDIAASAPSAEFKAEADGTSYMPAVIVPVPMIARIKTSVCEGLATQIKAMFEDA
jgi:hypothetical protein